MRFIALLKKTLLENLRDWKVIILTVSFAPCFVILMYLYFDSAIATYKIAVVNQDRFIETNDGGVKGGESIISALKKVRSEQGKSLVNVIIENDLEAAKLSLKKKAIDVVVLIPADFSKVLSAYQKGEKPPPAVVKTYGNPSNHKYMMAVVWSDIITYQVTASITGKTGPLELEANQVTDFRSINDFDLYMPGLLALALIMLMFTASASLIKEKDKGTLVRLRISNITAFEWVSSISLVQVLVGVAALIVTYLTAAGLGYKSSGSIVLMLLVGALSSVSIIAVSMVVSAYLRTIFDLMTIGCFPFFILMFFSGSMFPLPQLPIFSLAGKQVNITDILPVTHTVKAFNQVLNFNAGFGDILYELLAISLLTIIFFVIGGWLFYRRHLKAS